MSLTEIPGARVFRGSSLDDVIPRVKAELGPDAIIVCQREGYVGGIAGFFTRRCVEVEAVPPTIAPQAPAPTVPAGDAARAYVRSQPEEDTLVPGQVPVPAEALAAAPSLGDVAAGANGFTAVLERAVRQPFEPEAWPEPPPPAPTPVQVAAPARPPVLARSGHEPGGDEAGSIRRELVLAGLDSTDADMLVRQALLHHRPFAPEMPLRDAVRSTLSRSLRCRPGWQGHRRTIVLAGTEGAASADVAAALCSGYARAGLTVAALGLDGVRGAVRLATSTEDTHVAISVAEDALEVAPAVARLADYDLLVAVLPCVVPGDRAQQRRIGEMAGALPADDVQLVLPAGIDAVRARAAYDSLVAVSRVDAVLPTAVDISPHVGGVLSIARTAGLALDWMALDGWVITLVPADADDLARRMLP